MCYTVHPPHRIILRTIVSLQTRVSEVDVALALPLPPSSIFLSALSIPSSLSSRSPLSFIPLILLHLNRLLCLNRVNERQCEVPRELFYSSKIPNSSFLAVSSSRFFVLQKSDMGSNEEAMSSKSDKSSSSPAREQQNNVPIYPDWAAMQAYYGQRVALPPYFNSAVANGHPPPYMWGPPQMMMPPYGAPYAAIYSPRGVYAHPGVPYGSQPLGQGVPTSSAANVTLAGTALSIDTPAKSSGNTDQESMKKLKSFDGLAMSIGNGNSEKAEGEAEYKLQPKSSESEGSSYGSDQNTDGAYSHKRKRNSEDTPPSESHEIAESKPNPLPAGHVNSASEKVLGFPVTTTNGGGGETAGSVLAPPNVVTTLELRHAGLDVKANIATVTPNAIVPSETWMQNDRELKRERRKQSNRESARRSRLRKQAETEELAKRVEALTAENTALRTEINQLAENSNKLKLENTRLMGKLKEIQSEETSPNKTGLKKNVPVSTENLLSRVNNSGSGNSGESGGVKYDKGGSNSNSGAKLHQLLDASHRADAVAAR